MGNCCGRGSSRRQTRELPKANGALGAAESAKESSEPCEEDGATRVNISEEPDGIPLALDGCSTPLSQPTLPEPGSLARELASRPPSSARRKTLTHIQYVPPKEWSTCAYCLNPSGDRYGYFFCSSMPAHLLDTLMENGWWRTGKILFKPCFPLVCCPGYALRLPVAEFVVKKKHRRVIRRWAQFLRHGDSRWDTRLSPSTTAAVTGERECSSSPQTTSEAELVQAAVTGSVGGEGGSVEDTRHGVRSLASRDVATTADDERGDVAQKERERRQPRPGCGADPSRPPCRKAKLVRAEMRQRRSEQSGRSSDSPVTQPHLTDSLHELLADHRLAADSTPDFKHRLTVKLLGCNPCHPDLIKTLPKAYELYDKFQESVHKGKTRFKSAEEFRWGFMNSPITNPPTHLEGSYHMHYYLDGELVMVSILDILPKYFVSIYFIYDPAIRFMTPGIYTVLVELDLLQQLHTKQGSGPRPQYYALGYYNCNPKVSYKGQFKPQEVLCNETHTFVKMDSVGEKLSQMVYCRLASEEVPEKSGRTAPLDDLIVNLGWQMHGLFPVQFSVLDQQLQGCYSNPLRELVSEAGMEAAVQMIVSTKITPPQPTPSPTP